MAEEIIEIVSEDGIKLKNAAKSKAHQHGWYHRTVIGWLRYGSEWALVCQASDRQDAGQLVAPVGGHVKAGESVVEALLRESKEEIGASNIKYKHVGTAKFHRQVIGRNENHLMSVYEITTNDPIKLNKESVYIKRFTTKQLQKLITDKPEMIGNAHYFVMENFYPYFLPKDWVSRWL